MELSWQLLLGSHGALVIALSLLGYFLRRAEQSRTSLLEDLRRTQERLEAEHAGRLQDAKATTTTLLEVTDRIHKTLDSLERLGRRPP